MEELKKNKLYIYIIIINLIVLWFFYYYLFLDFRFLDNTIIKYITTSQIFLNFIFYNFKGLLIFKLIFLVLIFLIIYLEYNTLILKKEHNNLLIFFVLGTLLSAIIFILFPLNNILDYLFFPSSILIIFFLVELTKFDFFKVLKENNTLSLSKDFTEESISIDLVKNEKIIIYNPKQGVFICGGAGSGKSKSIIKPCIKQFIDKGYCGLMYDFEGNFLEEGGELTKHLYTTIKNKRKKDNEYKIKFACLNISDISRTIRCNPLSTKYLIDWNTCLEMSNTIMKNLNREWAEKPNDFWANNAIKTFAGTIFWFVRNEPKYCTLPHIIEFLLYSDFKEVMQIISKDDEIASYVAFVLAPFLTEGAGGQTAGVIASIQGTITSLKSPQIYYVLNPPEEEEFDLDITNKENPKALAICNDPFLMNSYSPVIGAVIQTIKKQMMLPNKNLSIFMFDELPTIFVNELDQVPALARKHGVATILALQSYEQLEKSYGNKNAKVILDNCGSLFVGMTSIETAEKVSKLLGDIEIENISKTISDGSISRSISTKEKKILKPSEIAMQSTGKFAGKIAGKKGFQVQTKYIEFESKEIPIFNKNFEKFFGKEKLNEKEQESLVIEKKQILEQNYNKIKKEVKGLILKRLNDLD